MTFTLKPSYFLILSFIMCFGFIGIITVVIKIKIILYIIISSLLTVILYILFKYYEPIYVIEGGYLRVIRRNGEKKYVLKNIEYISHFEGGDYKINTIDLMYEGDRILIYRSAKSPEGVSIEKYLINECGIDNWRKRKHK